MSDKKVIGVFDATARLVGSQVVDKDAPGLDFGDLPTDGSYRWDGRQFIPIGFGLEGRVAKPPCSTDLVLAELIRKLGMDASPILRDWLAWYEANGAERDSNRAELRRLIQKRRRSR